MATPAHIQLDAPSSSTELAFITAAELQLLTGILQDDQVREGSQGDYRHESNPYIDADSDLAAIESFLKEFEQSLNTLRSYTKDCLRYLLWARLVALKPLPALNADDVYAYERFLRQPPTAWCRPRLYKTHPDYKPFPLRLNNHTLNPDWRPFQGPLADSSVKVALAALKSLHAYMQDAHYTEGNPFNLRRHRRTATSAASGDVKHKTLSVRQWDLLQNTIEHLPNNTDRQHILKIRSHYIVAVFYFLGLRISEAVSAKMNGFYRDRDGRWWLSVTGKGSKHRDVPVPTDMFLILQDYRRVVLDAPPLPDKDETTPLITSLHQDEPVTANWLYKIVKGLFAKTALNLNGSSPEEAADKHFFERSTTHWLRYTYATNLIEKGATVRTAQLNLGHSSINTTMIYSHKDNNVRHKETDLLSKSMVDENIISSR